MDSRPGGQAETKQNSREMIMNVREVATFGGRRNIQLPSEVLAISYFLP